MTEEEKLPDDVVKHLRAAEYWVVVSRGPFGFRFGPYDGPSAGEILTEAVRRNVGVSVVANMGSEFNWQIAEDCSVGLRPGKFSADEWSKLSDEEQRVEVEKWEREHGA